MVFKVPLESVLPPSKALETKVQDFSSVPVKDLQPVVLMLLVNLDNLESRDNLDNRDNLVKDRLHLDLPALHLNPRHRHLEIEIRVPEFPDKAVKVRKVVKVREAHKVLVSLELLNQDLQAPTTTTTTLVLVPME